MRQHRSRMLAINRSLSIATVLLILLLWVANLPFYAGASVGRSFAWRMEHGRLTLTRTDVPGTESYFVDFNSEGLRFAWDGRFNSLDDWTVTIPLWTPLLGAIGWTVLAWMPRPRMGAGALAAADAAKPLGADGDREPQPKAAP